MILAHDVEGDVLGPRLLFLHSGITDRRMWDPQWQAFQDAGFRVVRCDLRGFGESPVPVDGQYNNAEDVVALLDLLDASSVHVVASSMGGGVALELAARWPQRVEALALVCTAIQAHEPTAELAKVWEDEERFIEAGDLDAATEVNVRAFIGPEGDAATREFVRRMQRHAFDVQAAAESEGEDAAPKEVPHGYDAITAPTLIVTGAHDLPDFTLMAQRLEAELTGAERIERVDLEWAGHLPTLERPEALNDLLLKFLGS